MILSISGKIGSGKDTTGKITQILLDNPHFVNNAVKVFLKREIFKPSFTIERWGGALKDITCLLIGCTREQLEDEEFKNKELGRDWRQYFITDAKYNRINTITYLSEKEVQEKLEKLNHKALSYDYSALTPRLLMQYVGTECGRNIIHPNIWVNALMNKYKPNIYWMCDRCMNHNIQQLLQIPSRFVKEGYMEDEHVCPICKGKESEGDITKVVQDDYLNWIITDTRFPNEHKAVLDRDGINIRVNRTYSKIPVNIPGEELNGITRQNFEDARPKHESETALDNATFDYTIENDGTLDELIDKIRNLLTTLKLI